MAATCGRIGRKLILAATMQPVLSYASEIWSRATQDHRRQLDGWQMGHVTSMLGLPATAAHQCAQQELGILPFHVVCEAAVLKFRHRLYLLPSLRQFAPGSQGS